MQDQSISMPFLSRPPRLDGTLAGDVGFDPLGFSNYFDIKWLREAELKHGRVSMLATLGFVVQEKIQLPGPGFDNKLATEAFFSVPAGGLWQIFFFLGALEVLTNNGKITPVTGEIAPNRSIKADVPLQGTMFTDGRAPGDLSFDPLNLSADESTLRYDAPAVHAFLMFWSPSLLLSSSSAKSPSARVADNVHESPFSRRRYELAEVKHARLAMIAIGGFVHQVPPSILPLAHSLALSLWSDSPLIVNLCRLLCRILARRSPPFAQDANASPALKRLCPLVQAIITKTPVLEQIANFQPLQ